MEAGLLFGKIAIKNQMLTELLVDEALTSQRAFANKGVTKTLGEILLDKGYLTEIEVNAIVSLQQNYQARSSDIQYGKIAVKNQLVSKDVLLECLREQQQTKSKDRIGEILVQKNLISFHDHCAILKAQSRLKLKVKQ